MPLSRQLSLFGVEARPASPLDFEGLLAGAGQVMRMGGTARVSIVIEDPWRARALLVEAGLRGIPATCERVGEPRVGYIRFRTAYSRALAPLGRAWLRGGQKRAPTGLVLDGRRLRLWAIAAGGPDGAVAFTLRLAADAGAGVDPNDGGDPSEGGDPGDGGDPGNGGDPTAGGDEALTWEIVGAGLAAAGLPAVLLTPRAGGPAYRIVGRRRLARLAELVGEAPAGAPPGGWP
ncbi:MAG: hypothetical protein QOI74_1787 [Micromonosporaceae bacterium]|nr:hypothetical protein [Micromonosporaceae bacterium]